MEDLSVVKSLVKPVEKLIDTISNAIGILYKPKAIRDKADADAYRTIKLARAKATSKVIEFETDLEIENRAKERFVHTEVIRQLNIENIADKAVQYLKETASETPVDKDWRSRFLSKCQDVSDDEIQEIWARILAEEVTAPGSTSARTLEVVSALSKQEAMLFQNACALTSFYQNILKVNNEHEFPQYGLDFFSILTLREAGLIRENDMTLTLLVFPIPTIIQNEITDKSTSVISFGKDVYQITLPNSTPQLIFNQIGLTASGTQLCKLLEIPPNSGHANAIITSLINQGCQAKKLDIKLGAQ
jgi:hypothetical protein